nr:hypothetical protein [Desulfobulbaceae bacterium]
MTVKINGDAISILSRHNFSKNVNSLSDSVEKLSSGLRINRYSDDPATSVIASQLNTQAISLGQAVQNANEAVTVMQIIDNSLSEAVDIVNTIRTKAVHGAQDAMTNSTRSVLQQDINTLLEELDLIVETSVYNDQKLLTGLFSNKRFQIGASANEDVNISIPSSKETRIGHLGTGILTLSSSSGGSVNFEFNNNLTGETLSVKSMTISYANDAAQGMGGVADYINRYSSDTGITAQAVVDSTSSAPISAGATASSFTINGVAIGAVNVAALDADGSLVNSINAKTTSHGVVATTSSSGQLSLVSTDGRSLQITGTGTIGVTDAELSTYGQLTILQNGSYKLNLTDLSEGFAVAFSSNMNISANITTTIDSTLTTGSVLGSGSILAPGSTTGMELSGSDIGADITTSQTSELLAGSVLASGSIVALGSNTGGTATAASDIVSQDISVLQSGSVLKSGSMIKKGSYLTNDITTASGTTSAGTVLAADATLTSDLSLDYDMLLLTGSSLASGSSFAAGSTIGADFSITGTLEVTKTMSLLAGSTIKNVEGSTLFSAGSTIGGSTTITASKTITQEMTVTTGSTLSSATQFAIGSTLGGTSVLNGAHVAIEDIFVESGSVLAENSRINGGTVITSSLQTTDGTVTAGSTLATDSVTIGSNALSVSMVLKSGSIVASGSTLAANSRNDAGVQLTAESILRLIDINVLSARDASTAIVIADAALKDLEEIRSAAGAYQSQFESSNSLLGGTQMQLLEARSKMIEVDFASEAENLTKMQLLVQSSAFALTQANVAPQNVFNILQGGGSQKINEFFISAANQKIFNN